MCNICKNFYLKKLLQDKRTTIICHFIMAVAVLPFVLMYPKNVSLIYINSQHTPTLDVIFYHITRLPELAFIVFVVVLALFAERKIFLAVVIGMSICGLSILLFKNILFSDFYRPSHWLLGNNILFHRVPGITLHSNGSFPSGHTIAAFSSLTFVALISKKPWAQFLLFVLACLSGYSRVYTAQHYLMDVYAGAVYGFVIAIVFYQIFNYSFKTPMWNTPLIKLKS